MIEISNSTAERLLRTITALSKTWKPHDVRGKNVLRQLLVAAAKIQKTIQKQKRND